MTETERIRLERIERQLREEKASRELAVGAGLMVLLYLALRRT